MPPPAATQVAARLRTARVAQQLQLTVSDVVSGVQNATEQCISRFQLIDAVHTRACTGIKKRP